jgi:type IV pilus secretin PilQ/predicted competence protein
MNARTGMDRSVLGLLLAGLLTGMSAAGAAPETVDLAGAEYARAGEVVTLRLSAGQELTFDAFAMQDPYRVVLDLVAVRAPWKVAAPEKDPLVTDLRSSLWKDSPEESIVRYVIETSAPVEHTVERTRDGIELRVWPVGGLSDEADLAPDPGPSPAATPFVSAGPLLPAGPMVSAGPFMSARGGETAQPWGSMLVPFEGPQPPATRTAAEVGEPEPIAMEIAPQTAAPAVIVPGASRALDPAAEEPVTPAPAAASPVTSAAAPAEWFAELSAETRPTDTEPHNVWSDEDCPDMWGDALILSWIPEERPAATPADSAPESPVPPGPDEAVSVTSWPAAPVVAADAGAVPHEAIGDLAEREGPLPAAQEEPAETSTADDPYDKVIARHKPGAERRARDTWLHGRPRHDQAPGFGSAGGARGFGQTHAAAQPMSLDVQGADVHTVLRSIAEYAGINIVADGNVKGAITLRALDLPWYDMLDSVCRAMGLVAMDHGSVIRVATERTAQDESLARESSARKQEDLMPLETAIVNLRYANAEELKTVVNAMRTGRGSVEIDERTNALIVTDIGPRLAELRRTLHELDTQTLQIEITAELVDVDATMSRQLGIAWGMSNLHSVGANASGAAGVSADDVVASAGNVQVGVLRSFGDVQARIQALATDNKADIISTPRITTVNNRMARILVGKEVPVITMDEAGNAITEYKKVGIALEVTPHVNSDAEITLDIHPEISDLSQEATVQGGVVFNTTEADTRVMVKDGQTAVIGGLLNTRKTKFERGVPVLKNLPVLGYLFRSSDEQDDKRELLIFVTPRIVVAEP